MGLRSIPAEIQAQASASGAAVYTSPEGGTYLVIRQADVWRVFVNNCPHRRLPLDRGGQVLTTEEGCLLVCANHGARFDALSGECVAGPCTGKRLRRMTALES